MHHKQYLTLESRALMGTWIEIHKPTHHLFANHVVPSWARGLKSTFFDLIYFFFNVVPSWARGLKYIPLDIYE